MIFDEVVAARLVFEGYRDGSFDLTQLISHRFRWSRQVKRSTWRPHPQADSNRKL